MAWLSDGERLEREGHVRGLAGGSGAEVLLICLGYPILSLFLHEATGAAYLAVPALRRHSAVVDAGAELLMTAAYLMIVAFAPGHLHLPTCALLVLSVFLRVVNLAAVDSGLRPRGPDGSAGKDARAAAVVVQNPRPSLERLRAGTSLLTVIAILGVDFPHFPRRLAKTEAFGTSLMDLGLGAFIFSSGLSAAAPPRDGARPRGLRSPRARRWAALLLLGLGRVALLRWLNYPSLDTEYGAHWNFFATLLCIDALDAAAGALAAAALPRGPGAWARSPALRAALGVLGAAALLVVHDGLLKVPGAAWAPHGNLEGFILHADRDGSFFRANREGICALPALWALRLLGDALGSAALFDGGLRRHGLRRSRARYVVLFAAARVLAALAAVAAAHALLRAARRQEPSRRLANAAYVLWAALVMTASLCACVLVDAVSSRTGALPLQRAVSAHPLPTFLAANLLTGAANLLATPRRASLPSAVAAVALYVLLVAGVALSLGRRDVRGGAKAKRA